MGKSIVKNEREDACLGSRHCCSIFRLFLQSQSVYIWFSVFDLCFFRAIAFNVSNTSFFHLQPYFLYSRLLSSDICKSTFVVAYLSLLFFPQQNTFIHAHFLSSHVLFCYGSCSIMCGMFSLYIAVKCCNLWIALLKYLDI